MTVDHDARRRRIAEAVASVTAREGLEAATIRRIAAELGGPTKTITYYFADKQELLLFTYGLLAQEYQDAVGAQPQDLMASLMAMAAADARSVARWRFYVAFWDRAARNPAFAELQRTHLDQAVAHLRARLEPLAAEGRDLDRISLVLNALVQGISVQVLADPARWPPAKIRAALAEQAALLLGGPVAPSDAPAPTD